MRVMKRKPVMATARGRVGTIVLIGPASFLGGAWLASKISILSLEDTTCRGSRLAPPLPLVEAVTSAHIESLLGARRYPEAIWAAREAVRRHPGAPMPRLQLARALLLMRRDEEAQIELEGCVRRYPGAAEPHRYLAELCIRRNAWGRARSHLFEALRIDPNDTASRLLLDVVEASSRQARPPCDAPTVQVSLPPLTPPRVLVAPPQRKRWQAWALAATLLALIGVVVGVAGSRHASVPSPPESITSLLAPVAACTEMKGPAPAAAVLSASEPERWIHPLPGPVRRMPLRDSRVFGAERPGDRPGECRSGHCGVDLGGEINREPVLAVHDGVIDRIQRGPNSLHGGRYVRIAHRDGTVFSWYFHLAEIPDHLTVGAPVRVGTVIGLVGQSGVVRSGPHLHFALTVAPPGDGPEQYIDPEPLIALWPLSTQTDSGASVIDTEARAGVPIGRRKLDRGRRATADLQRRSERAQSGLELVSHLAEPDDDLVPVVIPQR
jgi:murein DD-endopeptidase MepM/ murein hydrolase activator NlpD